MKISENIKKLIENKFGNEISYPVDCEALSEHIFNITKKRISYSTLKRLMGFVKGPDSARLSTLDIIAKYLSFKNWQELSLSIRNESDSDFINTEIINSQKLNINCIIEIKYPPNRTIRIKYIGNNIFKVIASENSKLCLNDLLEIYYIVKNQPLYVYQVIRNGIYLGEYIAGKNYGITEFSIIQ